LEIESLVPTRLEEPFRFVPAAETRILLGASEGPAAFDEGLAAFAPWWNDLPLDTHMADGGRYRRRRYAVLTSEGPAQQADEQLSIAPPSPHYQSLEHNKLNGGVARWFAPIEPEALEGACFRAISAFGLRMFRSLVPSGPAHVEAHQFRIEAHPDHAGRPTPEGRHRDGVDFVLVMLVRRENIVRGTTQIHDVETGSDESFTLATPGDLVVLDDRRVLHGVTPIVPLDPTKPAFRDVLVVTYRGA
jgi:hypothetical protein